MPTSWVNNGENEKIDLHYTVARVLGYKPIDPKDLTFTVTRKVANFFLKGAVSAAEFAHGSITAENGKRLKTGFNEVYNDSFLVFIQVGKELNIHKGDILVFKLRKVNQ